jgi:hypothetical protein
LLPIRAHSITPGLSRNPRQFRCGSLWALCPSCLALARTSYLALPSRGLAASIVGPLGLGSPRVRSGLSTSPAVLCVATTAFVRPGWFAFRSRPVPWVDASCFVFLPARAGVGSASVRVGQLPPGCCLRRSSVFRLSVPGRREALPSSRATPLNACPALRPRWCPARPLSREQDCCLPVTAHRRLWVRLPGLIRGPQLYIFRSSMTRPAFSPYLCFGHPLSGIALRFGCRPDG